MDFYHIGAMKVFSELGQFIEEDERKQIKLSDLLSDIMEKIGSYLLEDKNKTIHKIFKTDQIMIYKYFCLVR
jgi:23S rRNA maturation-related 3'-5' exoribonuclease YhaM